MAIWILTATIFPEIWKRLAIKVKWTSLEIKIHPLSKEKIMKVYSSTENPSMLFSLIKWLSAEQQVNVDLPM